MACLNGSAPRLIPVPIRERVARFGNQQVERRLEKDREVMPIAELIEFARGENRFGAGGTNKPGATAAAEPAFRAAAMHLTSAVTTRQPAAKAICAVRSVDRLSATITSIASAPPWNRSRATATEASTRGRYDDSLYAGMTRDIVGMDIWIMNVTGLAPPKDARNRPDATLRLRYATLPIRGKSLGDR